MAKEEWEKGRIKLPTAAWAGFKRALRTAYNEAILADFELIGRLHARIKADHKGKRGVNWEQAIKNEMYTEEAASRSWSGHQLSTPRYNFKVLAPWTVINSLHAKDMESGKIFLVTPQKKMFPQATSKTTSYRVGSESSISLNETTREVVWNVPQNNHACDTAHEEHLARVFFDLLAAVKWTRGTGGAIYGNDEYNRDSGRDYPGGGASYIKRTFGPAGDDAREDAHGIRRPRSSRR